MYAPDENVA